MKFIQFLNEKLFRNSVGVYIGRFQPPHIGHKQIINKMIAENSKCYVFIVNGEKSSQNMKKNPFSIEIRENLIRNMCSGNNVNIKVVKNAFLPDIFNSYLEENIKEINIYCGEDRIESYKKFENKVNQKINYIKTPRIISATEIRKMINNKEYIKAQKYIPYNINKILKD